MTDSKLHLDTINTLKIDLTDVHKYFDGSTLQILAEINQNKQLNGAERSVLTEMLMNNLGSHKRTVDPQFNRMINKMVEYKIDQKNKYQKSWGPTHFGGVEK
jgi:hypothetical protein